MLETYPGFATSHEPPSEQREGEVFLKIYQEMVAISEVSNMFWGLTLDSSKRYTQTVERSFHISMAALEVKTGKGESDESPFLSVMIQHEKAEFLLCTLEAGKLLQQPLDLNFTEGEEVTFFVNGKGTVHLTGYLQPEDEYPDDSMGEMSEEDEDEDSDDDSDDDSDEAPELVDCCGKRKRKADRDVVKKKLRVIEGDDDFDDSDDEDFAVQEAEDAGLDYSSGDSEDSDDDDDSEDDDDDDDDSEDDDSEESIEMDSDEEDNDEEDSDDEEEDSDEEDDDESEEKDMDLSGSFLHEKEAKNKKSTNGAVNGTPVKSPKKSPKNVKTETENTPKSDKKKDKSPKKQAQEKNKTPKSEKKEKSKSPKSEKKGNVVAEDSQGKMPKSEKKQEKPGKTPKSEKKQEKPEKTPKSEKKPEKTPKSDKKGKNKDQGEVNGQTPKKNEANKPKTPKKRVLAGGVTLEELKEGHGPDAKTGKMVHVYYKGNLQSGKQFDACQSGKPFKFRLGRQEVIKGWDNGLVGMKVGGKRKITIPPSQGYGSQRQGPIPANSTLVFEVELKAVS